MTDTEVPTTTGQLTLLRRLIEQCGTLKDPPPGLESVVKQANEFLEKAWSFEYHGEISKTNFSSVFKLVDIGVDLDDIFTKALGDKKEAKCEFYVLIEGKNASKV